MKTLMIFILGTVMTGCAHVSEYNQGCRDGIASVNVNNQGPLGPSKGIDKFCTDLDNLHKEKQEEPHGKSNG